MDPPSLFCIGALYAFLGRRGLVARAPRISGPSSAAAIFYSVLWWLAVQDSVSQAPDWMLTYLASAGDLNMTSVNLAFGVSCVLSSVAGHTLSALPLQRGRTGLACANLAAGATVLFTIWFTFLDQYLHVGTIAMYRSGDAPLLTQSPIAESINTQGIVLGLGFVVPAVLVYRASRRLRAT